MRTMHTITACWEYFTMAERDQGPTTSHFGSYYPTGYVVAVFDQRDQAEQAAQALREAAGEDADQVRVFAGEEVLAIDRRVREERTLGQRLGGLFASDEGEAQQQYLEAAQRGATIVTVHAPDLAAAQRAAAVLTPRGARALHHYGPNVMTDLTPRPGA
jgi:hypothetical protein